MILGGLQAIKSWTTFSVLVWC